MARFLAACSCALILVACDGGSDGEAPAWNHDPADTELGPTAWGELDESFEQCRSGESQSPVDLDRIDAVWADLPDLEFDYPETPLVVENTGHTIEVSIPDSSELTLTIEGTSYRLRRFHFHAPSEHTVDGRPYDGEVHLVHESEEGELAVVAVFLERSEVLIAFSVASLLESAPEEAGEEVELDGEWSPLYLVLLLANSTGFSGYYAYPGSLTTPGCTEDVRWLVSPHVHPTSPAAIERLHELIGGFPEYEGYENNNRPTQPLNERVVQQDSG